MPQLPSSERLLYTGNCTGKSTSSLIIITILKDRHYCKLYTNVIYKFIEEKEILVWGHLAVNGWIFLTQSSYTFQLLCCLDFGARCFWWVSVPEGGEQTTNVTKQTLQRELVTCFSSFALGVISSSSYCSIHHCEGNQTWVLSVFLMFLGGIKIPEMKHLQ